MVPVDTRALKAIKNSPLALDLYAWCTYKAYSLYMKGQAQTISYQELMRQFGTDYSDRKNFKRKLLATLKRIQEVFPELRIESVEGGLCIYPGKPSVPVADRNLLP